MMFSLSNTGALRLVTAVAAAWFATSMPGADDTPPAALVKVRVIQRNADARPASQDAQDAAEEPRVLTRSDDGMTVYVATAGRPLKLAGHVWNPAADRAGAKDSPPGGITSSVDAWTHYASPSVVAEVGKPASVQIGQRIPYMRKRDDGSLVVEQGEAVEGLAIDLTVADADEQAVKLDKLTVTLTRVVGREPIDGVPFDVGRPILRTLAISTSLRVSSDHIVIVQMPTRTDEQPIFVLVRAQCAKAASD